MESTSACSDRKSRRMMEMATCMRLAVAAGLAPLTGGCATEWARFSDHADPLDESRWCCRAEANEKWPEKMDVVERTEEIEVLTPARKARHATWMANTRRC